MGDVILHTATVGEVAVVLLALDACDAGERRDCARRNRASRDGIDVFVSIPTAEDKMEGLGDVNRRLAKCRSASRGRCGREGLTERIGHAESGQKVAALR